MKASSQGGGTDLYGAPIETRLFDVNGTLYKNWTSPKEISIPLSDMLRLANITLDEINPFASPDKDGNLPYWRMTGVTLGFDLNFKNFDGAEQMAIEFTFDMWFV